MTLNTILSVLTAGATIGFASFPLGGSFPPLAGGGGGGGGGDVFDSSESVIFSIIGV